MNSEFSELLNLFNACGVKFLIVGGHAVMFYGEPRYTKDLDIWIEASPENAERTFRALARFGAPLVNMTAADFQKEGFMYQLGRPPARIDILMSIDGVSFSDAWMNRQPATFAGVEVGIIGRTDLIKNKRASGRHIDLHDIEQLED